MTLENESTFLECKRWEVHPDSLAKELTAFANTLGDTVILGICDDKTIQEMIPTHIEEKIINICRNNISPLAYF